MGNVSDQGQLVTVPDPHSTEFRQYWDAKDG
jgi:YD repeat-containing protein